MPSRMRLLLLFAVTLALTGAAGGSTCESIGAGRMPIGLCRAASAPVKAALSVEPAVCGPSRPTPEAHPGSTALRAWAAPASVRLNEFLPAPYRIDWDGGGTPTHLDEWIELHNTSNSPCNLGGWKILVQGSHVSTHTIAPSTTLPPLGYLVLYRKDTGLELPNSAGRVQLFAPGVGIVDRYVYSTTGPDCSWGLTPDDLNWHAYCRPTPGEPNRVWHAAYLPLVLGGSEPAASHRQTTSGSP